MHIRTRFAPSPTGELHIGGVRTALFDYLYAKHFGGDFILRIEDTDRERFVEGSEQRILEGLRWLGIEPDEGPDIGGDFGPYRQSERLEIYQEKIQEILESGSAYYCFCSSERLKNLREQQKTQGLPPCYDGLCRGISYKEAKRRVDAGEKSVVRLKMPRIGQAVFKDMIRGRVTFDYKEIDDTVLLKSDGYPTYHFAAIVDDYLMKITHVFRSEEWLPSTPKHVVLYESFGWQMPVFAHVAFVVNDDRRKLSKRVDGEAVWLETYRKQGYLSWALVNYLTLLGWNPKTPEEIFTLEELVERFDGSGFNKAGAVFDLKKLDNVNAHYIKNLSLDEFQKEAMPYLQKRFGSDVLEVMSDIRKKLLFEVEQQRVTKFADIGNETLFVFEEQKYEPELLIWKKSDKAGALAMLQKAKTLLSDYEEDLNTENIERLIFDYLEKEGIGKGDFLWPLRVTLTGMQYSPGPFEALVLLGKDESMNRLEKAMTIIE